MSEERKMILQMLADGKISAEEANRLLEAIEESERVAEESVVESARKAERTADGLQALGGIVDSAVKEAYAALDETLRSMEDRLKHHEGKREQLKRHMEERIRSSTERALERALQAEERVARAAERAAQRAQEQAERLSRRLAEREESGGGRSPKKHFFKMGLHIDKHAVKRIDDLSIAALPGDRFVIDNRVGDIAVEFHDGDQIEVEARKTAWGSDEAEANQRADATQLRLVRNGSEVKAEIERPTFIMTLGFMQIKDTRIDFTVRLPRKTGLQVKTKVGDIRVEGDNQVAAWDLQTQVGDVDLTLVEDANFAYRLQTRLGAIDIALDEALAGPTGSQAQGLITGTHGEGGGQINAQVATGDIRLHH